MQVNIYEAKSKLSALVNQAMEGQQVVIARDGRPMVRLVPISRQKASSCGAMAGQILLTDDFDVPMPDAWFGV